MKRCSIKWIGFLLGVLYGSPLIAGGYRNEWEEIILGFNFSFFTNFNTSYLTWFLGQLIPFFFFEIIYGIWLYQRFGTANAYYFTRHINRKKWFYTETAKLFVHSFLYIVLYTAGYLGISWIGNDYVMTGDAFIVLLLVITLEALFLFVFTLLINLLSIWYSSMLGFLAAMGIQVVWIGSMLIFEVTSVTVLGGWLFRLNPFAQMILSWHSEEIWKSDVAVFPMSFPVWYSMVYFFLVNLFLIKFGEWVIQQDILEECAE